MQIVRRVIDAYRAGDIPAAVEGLDPEIEFDMTFRPDGRVFHGHQGVAEGMRTWTGTFEAWDFELVDILDGGEHVVATTQESGRGKGSGIEIDQTVVHLFRLRDGKALYWKPYLDRDEALKAARFSD